MPIGVKFQQLSAMGPEPSHKQDLSITSTTRQTVPSWGKSSPSSRSIGEGTAAASGRLQTLRALVSTLAQCPGAMVLGRDRSHSTARAPGQVHSAASQPQDLHFFHLKCYNEADPQSVSSLFFPHQLRLLHFSEKKNPTAAV